MSLFEGGLPSIFSAAHDQAADELDERGAFASLPDVRYQQDCEGFLIERLGFPPHTLRWSALGGAYEEHRWDGTPDPLVVVCRGLSDGEDVAVESAVGTGKTYAAAGIALWFLSCFEDALVVTLAPKEDQLTVQLWKEMGRHWERWRATYGRGYMQELRVRVQEPTDADRERWAIIGWACGVVANEESATRAQGFHARHMLIIVEETPGVPPPVMAALQNTSVGEHNLILALGNPNHQHDTLHVFATLPAVRHVRISAFDHPNVVTGEDVIPGATSRKGVQALRDKWGEQTPMFDSRARGISPAQAVSALIRAEWVDAAFARYRDEAERTRLYGHGLWAVGVDAAQSENGDQAADVWMRGAVVEEVRASACPDAAVWAGKLWTQMRLRDVRPEYVGVDAVGVGASAYNEFNRLIRELRAQQQPRLEFEDDDGEARRAAMPPLRTVVALYGGALPFQRTARAADGSAYEWATDGNLFNNLRSQMYWQLAADLRDGLIAVAPNETVRRQAVMPLWTDDAGKVVVESKKDMRKRLGVASPNELDALVYANWVRRRAAILAPKPRESSAGRDTTKIRPRWLDDDADEPSIQGSEQRRSTFGDFGGGF